MLMLLFTNKSCSALQRFWNLIAAKYSAGCIVVTQLSNIIDIVYARWCLKGRTKIG